jgi:hypothetical protein
MEPTEPTGATPSSKFSIDGELRDLYEKSVLNPNDADEIEVRRAITVWARKNNHEPPTGPVTAAPWMYSWN